MSDEEDLDKLIQRSWQSLDSGAETNPSQYLKLVKARSEMQKTNAAIAAVNGQTLPKEKVDQCAEVFAKVLRKHWPTPCDDSLDGLLSARNLTALSIELADDLSDLFGAPREPQEEAKNLLEHLQSMVEHKRAAIERERTGERCFQ